ncbi:hypothetical protein EVJ50_01530 [Synechococcus sp. RSCCF101]|uniref:hypothetical protein n=1 Tax=Synechococcus sp. RSCCF101 TaxID=2511069 RepID=UPI0012442CFF|nr:hypothetical protein [Synechococcus sp. RSCCF101]QEY31128.1 hypothetical protein EVJ50_01530 [Synechococcus sp. RSCCF101]
MSADGAALRQVLRPGDLALVNACGGGATDPVAGGPQPAALAAALGLPAIAIERGRDPVLCLRERREAPEAALLCIEEDPGRWLGAAEGSWSQALGDFQQATVLLVAPDASGRIGGAAAASAALLRAAGVPLIGLVQSAGLWDGASRRQDGLPWAGQLGGGSDGLEELALALRLRWQRLLSL